MTITAALSYGLGAFAVGYAVGLFIQSFRKLSEHL